MGEQGIRNSTAEISREVMDVRCVSLNLERMLSIEEVSAFELILSTSQEQGEMNSLIDPTELWNF